MVTEDVVREGGVVSILTGAEAKVLWHLYTRIGKSNPFPSQDTIGRQTNLSRQSVNRAVQRLKRLGLLQTQPRRSVLYYNMLMIEWRSLPLVAAWVSHQKAGGDTPLRQWLSLQCDTEHTHEHSQEHQVMAGGNDRPDIGKTEQFDVAAALVAEIGIREAADWVARNFSARKIAIARSIVVASTSKAEAAQRPADIVTRLKSGALEFSADVPNGKRKLVDLLANRQRSSLNRALEALEESASCGDTGAALALAIGRSLDDLQEVPEFQDGLLFLTRAPIDTVQARLLAIGSRRQDECL